MNKPDNDKKPDKKPNKATKDINIASEDLGGSLIMMQEDQKFDSCSRIAQKACTSEQTSTAVSFFESIPLFGLFFGRTISKLPQRSCNGCGHKFDKGERFFHCRELGCDYDLCFEKGRKCGEGGEDGPTGQFYENHRKVKCHGLFDTWTQ